MGTGSLPQWMTKLLDLDFKSEEVENYDLLSTLALAHNATSQSKRPLLNVSTLAGELLGSRGFVA